MKQVIFYFFLLLVFCCHRCDAQNVAFYSRYDNYSCVDVDPVPGFIVPTLQDCVAYSTVSPLTNGVVYQDAENVCKLLTNSNNSILIRLHVKTGWTTFVKNTSATYQLVFKTDANIPGLSNYTSNLWNNTARGYTTTYTPQVASLNRSSSCSCVYRNEFIDNWKALQAKVVIIFGGLSVVELIFDGGTTKTDWFSQENLISAVPYKLSVIRKQNFTLSIPISLVITDLARWFAILRTLSDSCFASAGYIGVLSTSNYCNFSQSTAYPTILYSMTDSPSNLSDPAVHGRGDMILIYVKTGDRVVLSP